MPPNIADHLQSGDRRFRELLDHLAQAAFVIAQDGLAAYVNPAAGRLFSSPLADLLQRPFPYPVMEGTSDLVIRRPDGSSFPASMWAIATVWEAHPVHLVTLTETSRQIKKPSQFQQTNERIQHWVGELEHRNRDTALLNEVIDNLQDCRQPEDMFAVVTRYTPRLFEGLSGTLYLFNPVSNRLEYTASWGENPPAETSIPVQECLAFQNKTQVQNLPTLLGFGCQLATMDDSLYHLCSPMISQREVIGILHLIGPSFLPGGDILSLEYLKQKTHIFSEQVGITLANLRLRENLNTSALVDSSTGLYNRRYIDEFVERELRRSIRHERSMVVIMVELESYPALVSNYGQQVADDVVKAAAGYLLSQLRREDLVCRMAEQQFIILLPEAILANVSRRAEVMRVGAKTIRIQVQNTSLKPVIMSLGVSAYPEHGASVRELLKSAEKALHIALEAGGDRVVLASSNAMFAEMPSSG